MIDELDETLRRLLVRELPVKNGDVNIEFAQPKHEWSLRMGRRPTLNLFLYDLHENNTLRQPEWQVTRNGNGMAVKQRTPTRVDLHYMITAWAGDSDDEHRLLSRALLALLRHPVLPVELLPDNLRTQNEKVAIPVRVAEQGGLRNPADIWGAMDQELRPAIACTITLAFDPHQPVTGPTVKSRDLRFRNSIVDELADRFWMVGGTVRGAANPERLQATLLERGLEVALKANGDFVIGNLAEGDYTLDLTAPGLEPRQHKFTVPSMSYDIDWDEGGAVDESKK